MYYGEHDPPHFHVKYGDYEASIRIQDGAVEGKLPRRALSLVLEWYGMHRDELMDDWNLAQQRRPLRKIEPLE